MKTLIVAVIAIIILVSTSASAQTTTGFAEGQFQFVNSSTVKTLDVALTNPIKNGWAIETWALKCDGWGEVYLGVSKSPASWISLTGQVGFEQADAPWRVAGTLWMGTSKFSALVIIEDGGSGLWHKVVVTGPSLRTSNGTARAGIMSQRYVGTGPFVELEFGKTAVWLTIPVVGGTGALAGVKLSF